MRSSIFVIGKTQLASDRAHPSVNTDSNHYFRLPRIDRCFSGRLSGDLYLSQELPLFGGQLIEEPIDIEMSKQRFLSKFGCNLVL